MTPKPNKEHHPTKGLPITTLEDDAVMGVTNSDSHLRSASKQKKAASRRVRIFKRSWAADTTRNLTDLLNYCNKISNTLKSEIVLLVGFERDGDRQRHDTEQNNAHENHEIQYVPIRRIVGLHGIKQKTILTAVLTQSKCVIPDKQHLGKYR